MQDARGMQRFNAEDNFSKVKLQPRQSERGGVRAKSRSYTGATFTSFSSMGERASMCCSNCPPLA